MSKIVLKITPVDYYFFGSENINVTTREANYYLKSTPLPQQTTVLGAIRYALLLNSDKSVFENNRIVDKQKAKDLIGEKSFELNETIFDFGSIKSLSPVFLIDKNNVKHIPCPLINTNDLFEMKTGLPFIQKYDAKQGYHIKYTNGQDVVDEKEIFEKLVLTQNKKDKISNEDAFFKTQYYTLKGYWSFGIDLEIEDDNRLPNSFVMKMGGENRLFMFNKTTIDTTATLNSYASPTHFVIAFMSDTYIKEYNASLFDFAIINTVPFRYLSSTVSETEKYTHRSKTDNKELKASKLIELIEKGSIFYFKTENQMKLFEKQITSDYLQRAGLNHYIILTPNKN